MIQNPVLHVYGVRSSTRDGSLKVATIIVIGDRQTGRLGDSGRFWQDWHKSKSTKFKISPLVRLYMKCCLYSHIIFRIERNLILEQKLDDVCMLVHNRKEDSLPLADFLPLPRTIGSCGSEIITPPTEAFSSSSFSHVDVRFMRRSFTVYFCTKSSIILFT